MALAVQIGVNPVSWMNDDLPSLGRETPVEVALSEGRRIGYLGFELGCRFPRDPETLRALFAAHDLACISGWYSGRLISRSADVELEEAESHLGLLKANDAKVLIYGEVEGSIQGLAEVPLYKRPRLRGDAAWRAYGEKLTTFARAVKARGLRLAYHHHMGAYVETPEDVDRLMAATGPEVGLLVDSGHAAFAGGDAVELLEHHAARVCHVHLKDVRPAVVRMAKNRRYSFLQSVLSGVFTVPGDGALDFGPLLRTLSRNGYAGWLVVEAEQDPAVAPSYASAEKGFRHIEGLVRQLKTEPREAA